MRNLLPTLRDIGFRLWDPLGLSADVGAGEAPGGEYDSYLMRAFSAAANGADITAIAELLRTAEIDMGVQLGVQAPRRLLAAEELFSTACRSRTNC